MKFGGSLGSPSDPQISLVIANMFHQVPSPKTLSVIVLFVMILNFVNLGFFLIFTRVI
jgi:hypothetical protein